MAPWPCSEVRLLRTSSTCLGMAPFLLHLPRLWLRPQPRPSSFPRTAPELLPHLPQSSPAPSPFPNPILHLHRYLLLFLLHLPRRSSPSFSSLTRPGATHLSRNAPEPSPSPQMPHGASSASSAGAGRQCPLAVPGAPDTCPPLQVTITGC